MQITNWYFRCFCVVKSYSEGPGNEATVMNGVLVLAEVGGEGLETKDTWTVSLYFADHENSTP